VDGGLCSNTGGDYNLDRASNERPSSSAPGFGSISHATWATGWCGGAGYDGNGILDGCAAGHGGTLTQANLPTLSTPCALLCTGNLGRNTFVGPGLWSTDMTLAKSFKFTERVNLKFEAAAFNIFNRANFVLATAGGGAHNHVTDGSFGKAAGTLNSRNMQIGLKLSF
jgi:hypothetical protein